VNEPGKIKLPDDDPVVVEESPEVRSSLIESAEIGAGVPKLQAPLVKGGLSAPTQIENLVNKDIDRSCRICLDESETEKNPLITPCKCIGSVRYIHFDCLKAWLNQKKQIQESEGV
jgi:RING-variant domain